MADQFCAACGAQRVGSGQFCVECGARHPGAAPARVQDDGSTARFAPLFVVVVVLLIGVGAIGSGLLFPPEKAPVPPAPQAPFAGGGMPAGGPQQGAMPESHPPLQLPQEVTDELRIIVAAAEAAPDDLDAWQKAGDAQYRAAQIDRSYLAGARTAYQRVMELDPEHLDALRNLGNIAFDLQETDAAISLYERYLDKKPEDTVVRTDLGTMLLSSGNPERAVELLEAVVTQKPEFFQARLRLAVAYRVLGQMDRSIQALERARDDVPDEAARAELTAIIQQAQAAQAAGGVVADPHAAAPVAAAGNVAPAAPTDFRGAVETIFRSNPVMGSKVVRLDWEGPHQAKLYMRDFPMDQMGEGMLGMFQARMQGRLQTQKDAHGITETVHVDIIDEATDRVMASIEK